LCCRRPDGQNEGCECNGNAEYAGNVPDHDSLLSARWRWEEGRRQEAKF
jgi:hypothetical protein